MSIREFFNTYIDLWVETNKSTNLATNDQCVDLWRVFNMKVVGGPFMLGNAVDFWTNYPTAFYDKIPNTPTGVPQMGDTIIWGTKYAPYGHIAICTELVDVKNFTSFDQNDPIGSACHFQPHTYTGVLGWLRPKQLPQEEVNDNVESLNAKITELSKKLSDEIQANAELRTTNVNLQGDIKQQEEDNKQLLEDNRKAELDKQNALSDLKDMTGQHQSCQVDLKTATEALTGAEYRIIKGLSLWEILKIKFER